METDGTGALAIIPNNATLFGKMAQVMKLVSRVPKNGFNTFHKYKYAMADDVADCIRDAMGESNLALFVEMGEPNQETIEGDNNKMMIRTTIRFIFTFACGDTGATMSKTWVGQVDDNSDKAISKCATAAEKYFLMKTFIVSAGDEPDADSDKHREEAGHKVEAPKVWHDERALHELSERSFTAGYITERNGKGVAELVTMIAPKTWDDFTDRNAAALAIKEIGEAAKAAKAAAKVKPPEPEITEPGAAALANGLAGKSPFAPPGAATMSNGVSVATPEPPF